MGGEWAKSRLGRAVGVPRRFAVGTGLVILTMYSLLFGLLTWLEALPLLFLAIVAFLTGIGIAQMALFGGRKPRKASIVAGALLLPAIWHAGLWGAVVLGKGPNSWTELIFCITMTPYLFLAGIPLGYFGGSATAGAFVLLERLARRQAEIRRRRAAGPQSPWDEPPANTDEVQEKEAAHEKGSAEPTAEEETRPAWDDWFWRRLPRMVRWLGPYHRRRPWGDAFSLSLLLCLCVTLVMPVLSLLEATKAMLLLCAYVPIVSYAYLVARSHAARWSFLMAVLSAACAWRTTRFLLERLYVSGETCRWVAVDMLGIDEGEVDVDLINSVAEYVPLWTTVALGAVAGSLFGFLVLALAHVWRRFRPRRHVGLSVAISFGLILAVHVGIYLGLNRVANTLEQRQMHWAYQHKGKWITWPAAPRSSTPGAAELCVNCLFDSHMDGLAMFDNVVDLRLFGYHVSDKGLAALRNHNAITSLRLGCEPCTGSGLKHLSRPDRVRELALQSESITDEGLADVLERFTNLDTLKICNAPITDAALTQLGKCRKLTTIYLLDTKITGTAFKHLRNLPQLDAIGCVGTPIGDEAMEHIGAMKTLTYLNLWGTNITDVGLAHLRNMPMLTEFHLFYTDVTGQGFAGVRGLPSLTEIDLSGTKLTDAGLAHLAKLKSLQDVGLVATNIGDRGISHLKGLPRLNNLDIGETQVTEAAIPDLLKPPAGCSLMIRETPLSGSAEARERLEKGFPGGVY